MGLFDWLFGGGDTTVITQPSTTTGQTTKVEVNPTTQVALAIDTSSLGTAIQKFAKDLKTLIANELTIEQKTETERKAFIEKWLKIIVPTMALVLLLRGRKK